MRQGRTKEGKGKKWHALIRDREAREEGKEEKKGMVKDGDEGRGDAGVD